MKDRIRDAPVFSLCRVKVVGHELVPSLLLQRHILEHGVRVNRAVNIRLCLLAKIDRLGVAPALKVEDAVLVPAVLVVSDERALRVGRQRRLPGATEPEEKSRVAFLSYIGRAVHRELRRVLHGQPVVHQGEDALLVLAAVPRPEDDRALLLHIEYHSHLRVEPVLFPVLVDLGAGVDDSEVGLETLQVRDVVGAYKHVGDKVLLPRHFRNKKVRDVRSL